MWSEIEKESGETLLRPSGFLVVGEVECDELKKYESTARGEYLTLNSKQMNEKWPKLNLPDGLKGLFDLKGGTMHAKKSLVAFKTLSEKNGAQLFYNSKVESIKSGIICNGKVISARHVIICCGHT
jgi:glycine/D-amino acid oxidase-like deaminating enzyme